MLELRCRFHPFGQHFERVTASVAVAYALGLPPSDLVNNV